MWTRPLVPFVSIDPGIDYLAWALWYEGGDLSETGMLDRAQWSALGELFPTLAIIERPQIYRFGKAKTKDVEGLLIASGEIASHFQQVVWFQPAVWKGQQPKAAHQKKIAAACNERELDILSGHSKKELKHIWDAVGLGLFYLGRLT